MARKKTDNAQKVEPDQDAVLMAIAEGKTLIEQGKPKIEAAMAIFAKLEGQSQETIVAAFIEGASLTPKGALTYWYNCRRKAAKSRLIKAVNPSDGGDVN